MQLLYCSSMKITFCYGSACTWNQIVHEFHYLDTYIWFQGLFWLTKRVLLSSDLQKGTWLIQRWLIQLHSLNWKLLASPTLHVISQNYIAKFSWLWIWQLVPTGMAAGALIIQSFVHENCVLHNSNHATPSCSCIFKTSVISLDTYNHSLLYVMKYGSHSLIIMK